MDTTEAQRPVALITGASRGIGRATAVALSRRGFDVAVTARTAEAEEGEAREHSPTALRSNTTPVPGSLRGTARLVEEAGGRALIAPADLLDRTAMAKVVDQAIAEFGRIDVLVNNARFTGPGHMDKFLDTPLEYIEKTMEANYFAPLVLIRLVLPHMLEQGSGWILNVTSGAAFRDPFAPPGEGWCSANYAASKAALFRLAPYLQVEHGARGIRCFNVDPGLVVSERVAMETGGFGVDLSRGAPPEAVAAGMAWLVTSPEADRLSGQRVDSQKICHEQSLLPGWAGPQKYATTTAR